MASLIHRLLEHVLRRCEILDEKERLIKVRSLRPYFNGRTLEWPVLIVEKPGQRASVVPVWDRVRWYRLLIWAG